MILLNKPISLTPWQAIQKLKEERPELQDKSISYAGRLDPMAEGLLLLLVDEENKQRKQYEDMKKTYEFTVLLGIETDTYDILGKVKNPQQTQHTGYSDIKTIRASEFSEIPSIQSILKSIPGTHFQPYPPYSSKTVRGKPLYWWARNGKLDEIEIPTRNIEIYDLQLINESRITKYELQNTVVNRIRKVQGNFRQAEILALWDLYFQQPENQTTRKPDNYFHILNCTITCSSGTYIRGIANEIGKKLGCGAIALTIRRTGIGEWSLKDAKV